MPTETPDHVIHADPSKDFFVSMITRDISLDDCIFDLLDNSVDGARRCLQAAGGASLNGYDIAINLSPSRFEMTDNCGGISLAAAVDYAFHFGRRKGETDDLKKGIGLYGIGMKRALFKMGRLSRVISETPVDSFTVVIDVDVWEQQPGWDFSWSDYPRRGINGTQIVVEGLYHTISKDFADSAFSTNLIMRIARDYAFFIQAGLTVRLNNVSVPAYRYDLKQGTAFSPASIEYPDGPVRVRIIAGVIDSLPDEIPDDLQPKDVDRYGWFVICNGRVVLAADKSASTVWGSDGFPIFHPQYRGFAGFAFFDSDKPNLLPWTTTKHDIDASDPLYRRAVEKMKAVTLEFINYSKERRGDLEEAKQLEQQAAAVDISSVKAESRMQFPVIQRDVQRLSQTIVYKRPKADIDEIRAALGNVYMSAKDVGIKTFEYFRRMELGK